MILFFILIFLFFAIITSKIKVEVKDFDIDTQYPKYIKENYEVKIIYKIFDKIPILKYTINSEKISKLLTNEKVEKRIEKEKKKLIESRFNIDKNIIKDVKRVKAYIKEFKLKIIIGTEDSALTAIIIPILSTGIAIFLENKIKKLDRNVYFKISPVYHNQNLIKIDFSGIFELKMIHIINTICILSKKRKGDKNERASNRRSYDYSYE